MLFAYVFALVVGLGVLLIQTLLGGKDVDHGGLDDHFEVNTDAHIGSADAPHASDGADRDLAPGGGSHFFSLLLSTRFWIFSLLGFGLSGTLLTAFSVALFTVLPIAIGAGLASGFSAALAFRALRKSSGRAAEDVSTAIGRVARVVVPASLGRVGRVRIEIGGRSVDLAVRAEAEALERGAEVVIDDVEGETAHVTRVPPELR